MASIARLVNGFPVPLFGTVRTAAVFTVAKAKALPRMAGWAVPLAVGGLWFVWPAVDDGWKIEMGIMADPEAAAKAAAEEAKKKEYEARAAADAPRHFYTYQPHMQGADGAAPKVEGGASLLGLSAEAQSKVENAYKAHVHIETDDDKALAKATASGDFSYFEEKWEAFADKSSRPGEDDEDEDEEEDDEEEEDDDDDDDDE